MNSKKKIDILSPEEMRQETIDSAMQNTDGECAISRTCENGREVVCSGATCKEEYETLGGKRMLKYIECLDENGALITHEACNNHDIGSGSGSGSSGTPDSPLSACANSTFGSGCEWRDETALMHYGTCQYDFESPKLTLICK